MARDAAVKDYMERHPAFRAEFLGPADEGVSTFFSTIGGRQRKGFLFDGDGDWKGFAFQIEGINHERAIIYQQVVRRQDFHGHTRLYGEVLHYSFRQPVPEECIGKVLDPWFAIANNELGVIEHMLFSKAILIPNQNAADFLHGAAAGARH